VVADRTADFAPAASIDWTNTSRAPSGPIDSRHGSRVSLPDPVTGSTQGPHVDPSFDSRSTSVAASPS
jgi:hypothetical protein